jgi:hypothetical protein
LSAEGFLYKFGTEQTLKMRPPDQVGMTVVGVVVRGGRLVLIGLIVRRNSGVIACRFCCINTFKLLSNNHQMLVSSSVYLDLEKLQSYIVIYQ